MKQTLSLLLCLLSLAGFAAGCSSAKKGAKPKVQPGLAAETEESFRQRWVEKRGAELVAAGLRADIARQQALDEFQERFGYLRGAAQK